MKITQKAAEFIKQFPMIEDASIVLDPTAKINLFRNHKEQSLDIVDLVKNENGRLEKRSVAYVKYEALGDDPHAEVMNLIHNLFQKRTGVRL